VWYIASSALVAALLERDTTVRKKIPRGTQLVTSALTLAEAGRAIIRARATGRLTTEEEQGAFRALRRFERRCFTLEVDRAVLARVRRPCPAEPIRTLDAVQLATVELLDEASPLVTVVTRDDRVREECRSAWPRRRMSAGKTEGRKGGRAERRSNPRARPSSPGRSSEARPASAKRDRERSERKRVGVGPHPH
jgi:predicted nucleic acid-binding protein